jgi:hypothetical protein
MLDIFDQNQSCGSGSGIVCLFDPWTMDPGWEKINNPDPGSGMNNQDHIFEAWKPFFCFLVVKIIKFFDEDLVWRQFGSGIGNEKNRIQIRHTDQK